MRVIYYFQSEALPVFLGAADEQVAKEAWKLFTKQGLAIELGVKIGAVTVGKNVTVEYSDREGNRTLFDFSGYQRHAVSADLFHFTPPAGVQVVSAQ